MFENSTLVAVGRPVPVIESEVPDRVKPVTEPVGAT
jgi:hypothetical protein